MASYEFNLKSNFLTFFENTVETKHLGQLSPKDLLYECLGQAKVRDAFSEMDSKQIGEFIVEILPECISIDSSLQSLTLLFPNLNLSEALSTLVLDSKLEDSNLLRVIEAYDDKLSLYVSDREVLRDKLFEQIIALDSSQFYRALQHLVYNDSFYHLKNKILEHEKGVEFCIHFIDDAFKNGPSNVLALTMLLGDRFVKDLKSDNFKNFMEEHLERNLKDKNIEKFKEKFQLYSYLVRAEEVDKFLLKTAQVAKKAFDQSFISFSDKTTLTRIYEFNLSREDIQAPKSFEELVSLVKAVNEANEQEEVKLKERINEDYFSKIVIMRLFEQVDNLNATNIGEWLDCFATVATLRDDYDFDSIYKGNLRFVTQQYESKFENQSDKLILETYVVNHFDFNQAKNKIKSIALGLRVPESVDSIDEEFIRGVSNILKFALYEKDFKAGFEFDEKKLEIYQALAEFLDDYRTGNYCLYDFRRFLVDVATFFIFSETESALYKVPTKKCNEIGQKLLKLADDISLASCYEVRRAEVLLEGMVLEIEQQVDFVSEEELELLFDNIISVISSIDYHLDERAVFVILQAMLSSRRELSPLTEFHDFVLDELITRYSEQDGRVSILSKKEAALLVDVFDVTYIYCYDKEEENGILTKSFELAKATEKDDMLDEDIFLKTRKIYEIVANKFDFQVDIDGRNENEQNLAALLKLTAFEFALSSLSGDELNQAVGKFKEVITGFNNEILNGVYSDKFVRSIFSSFRVFLGSGIDEVINFLRSENRRMEIAINGKENKQASYLIEQLKKRLDK